MIIFKFVAVAILGYLIGSIPFGVIISKQKANVDVTQYGSGRTGATNVLRTVGRGAAISTALLDILKGALSVIFAGLIIGQDYITIGSNIGLGLLFAQMIAGLAAMLGHTYSIFLHFKGGRGVAVFFGALFALIPVAGLFGGEALLISAGLSGFMSLASLVGAVSTVAIMIPLTIVSDFPVEYLIFALGGTLLISFGHRDNIKRLVNGKERRLGEKVVISAKKEPQA